MPTQRCFKLISNRDPQYPEVCRLLRERFATVFQANVARQPTMTLVMTTPEDQEITACMTMNEDQGSAFFSERYLDSPVEVVASRVLKRPVSRYQIIELGGLATRRWDGAGTELIRQAPWFMVGLGYRYALMTATSSLRRAIERYTAPFATLGPAYIEALPEEERAQWGDYYKHNPTVGVIDLLEAANRWLSNTRPEHNVHEMVVRLQTEAVG